jgi:hypothetical protein
MKTESRTETSETVHVSKSLIDRIQKRLSQTDFKTVDEYISYVLDNVLKELEESQAPQKGEKVFSKEEEEGVEERLRNLGYM